MEKPPSCRQTHLSWGSSASGTPRAQTSAGCGGEWWTAQRRPSARPLHGFERCMRDPSCAILRPRWMTGSRHLQRREDLVGQDQLRGTPGAGPAASIAALAARDALSFARGAPLRRRRVGRSAQPSRRPVSGWRTAAGPRTSTGFFGASSSGSPPPIRRRYAAPSSSGSNACCSRRTSRTPRSPMSSNCRRCAPC